MNKRQPILLWGLMAMLTSAFLFGQEELSALPEQVYTVDDTGELKIFSDLTIPADEIRTGKLRVIGGNLTVIGTVTGRIIVIGGDVDIKSSAVVEGTIVALGGKITRADGAEISGEVLEINSGKLSLSRRQAADIFNRNEAEEDALKSAWYEDDRYSKSYDYKIKRRDEISKKVKRIRRIKLSHRSRVRSDFGVPSDVVVRYNRAEGAALYIPFSPDTDDLNGFHIQSMIGYASGPNKFYGRIGIGQYLFDHRIGVIAEAHLAPTHNDGWRLASEENFLGALLIHEDWYDWYETEGYGGSLVAYPFSWLKLGAQYLLEEHRRMHTTVNWSLFGRDKTFRPGYAITAGKDENMTYHLRVGNDIGLFHKGFKANFGGSYTTTMPTSDFAYTRQEFNAGTFFNFQRRLGVRASVKTGATLNSGSGGSLGYGLQHKVPVGGIGSIGGYDYKDESGSHFAVINVDFSLLDRSGDVLSILWQYGAAWEAEYNLFTGDYLSDLQAGGRQSIGFRFGDESTRFEIFRTLSGKTTEYAFYFRFMDL
ncbi:MAG: polymer-forming cytoskeletal protein [Candidatus Marinimicrobia bacterium]|nr:polymer-forming cytoskeletal protein [Candidatus Neomarinimicrobiota bacterium]